MSMIWTPWGVVADPAGCTVSSRYLPSRVTVRPQAPPPVVRTLTRLADVRCCLMIAIPFDDPLSDATAYLPSGVVATAKGEPGSDRSCRVGFIACAEARAGALNSAPAARMAIGAR